jgi:CRISPR-associated protein Csm2
MPNDRQQRPPQGQRPQQRQEGAIPAPQFNAIKLAKPLDPELFNTRAQGAAQAVSRGDTQRNKSTQLRRFYDELVAWESRVNQQPAKFDEYLPFIRMLNAKAAYAEGRRLVDRTFVNLLQHTLGEVEDPETLTACKLFWEAFMGFYKQERPGND